MQPYFNRVRQLVPVTNTPSTDGVPQNTGPAQIAHPLYANAGWVEADTSQPFTGEGVYGAPYVGADGGQRAGPISGYFAAVDPAGAPLAGLEILPFTKADRIVLAEGGRARAVQYTNRGALDQTLPGKPGTARLKRGGLLVMAAGALITPRLLLLSGIGPRGREAEIFPNQSPAPFAIGNQQVGTNLFDHVMSAITYGYSGSVPYQAYNYGDYSGNAGDLDNYLAAAADHTRSTSQYRF